MEKITEEELESIMQKPDLIIPGEDIDFNTLPDPLEPIETNTVDNPLINDRDEIDVGLSLEDFKNMILYIKGVTSKPKFIDNLTADAEDRLKDIVHIMNFSQLSKIPTLIALQSQIQDRLYAPENLYAMDIKDLTSASNNVSKEIQSILDSAIKTMQTTSQLGSLNNEYRNLIDLILNLPEDKLSRIKEIVMNQD